MRRSRADAAETRRKVVRAASELLRARGRDGVSVADAMATAGMTPGGFYKHFADKDALLEESFDSASNDSVVRGRRAAEAAPRGRALRTIVRAYLTMAHRDDAAHGCPLAACVSDAPHAGKGFRRAFTAGILRMLDGITEAAVRDGRHLGRPQAMALLASLVGAVTLARATDDDALAAQLLEAVADLW
jgi:TetR/AcrR family transcriptional regulator, transcriptional repressor for nem operon